MAAATEIFRMVVGAIVAGCMVVLCVALTRMVWIEGTKRSRE